MKKLYILVIFIVLSYGLHSQDFIPLLIDSSHSWKWTGGPNGSTELTESWAGYTYDALDRLVYTNSPDLRVIRAYGIDTLFLITATPDQNGEWHIYGRSFTAFDNGKITKKHIERYRNNEYENSILHSYFYNDAGSEILYTLQNWSNNAWIDFYKKESIYDKRGNKVEEAVYYTDNHDEYEYNRGELYEYDDANRLIHQIQINNSINGPYYIDRKNWIYGKNDIVDTIWTCSYSINNICKNDVMDVFDYSSEDTITLNNFRWMSNEWKYMGKELTFSGPKIYSEKPDSIIYYYYWEDSLLHTPVIRRYYEYKDLGNDTIYFQQEEYNYKPSTNTWFMWKLIKEWYHLKSTVNTSETISGHSEVSIYPNPGFAGQRLTINGLTMNGKEREALIFDLNGKLISGKILTNKSSLAAPLNAGIYTIIIREEDRLVGAIKQVVIQ